jgi:phenylalanyl-tRNA synthetase beta chain
MLLTKILNWWKGTRANLIIVVEVLTIDKHPKADRLQIVSVTDGKQTVKPIVCGAFNFQVGDKVALALPGATIPRSTHSHNQKPFILTKAVIRGIQSQGMLCSGYELGKSDHDKEGILILPQNTVLGTIV